MRVDQIKEKLAKQKEQLTLLDQQRVFLLGSIAILEDLIKNGAGVRRSKRESKAEVKEEGPQPASNNSARA